jgi:hypothetical protein
LRGVIEEVEVDRLILEKNNLEILLSSHYQRLREIHQLHHGLKDQVFLLQETKEWMLLLC